MFIGTNDVLLGKKPVDEILAAYDTMLAQMRAKNPKVQIVFSNLTPLDPARWGQAGAVGIEALNAAIKTYAPGKSTRGSPVYFVDNFGGFDPVADTDDGEHPNVEGNEKIASKFLESTRTSIEAARAADGASTKRVSVQARRVLAVEGVK
jgi:lysophospholipase L1-like esterase